MFENFFRTRLTEVPVVAILRSLDVPTTLEIANNCWDAGIRLVEVPAQGKSGLTALRAAADAGAKRGELVGAGTVYSLELARKAVDAGAGFLVAPGLSEPVVDYAAAQNVPYLPGVTTPTEVQAALALDIHVTKLFPAAPLGSAWIGALHGPFPEMGFVAVGGINHGNAEEFLRAGALGVGAGGAFADTQAIHAFAALRPHRPPT